MKKLFPVLSFLILHLFSPAQVQTIRGTVTEKATRLPLPGANIILLDSDPLYGVVADENGNFRMENIPVGRQSIRVSFTGYNPVTLTNLVITSGKETILNIELEELVLFGEEGIEVRANKNKENPINEMALISARQFSVEETQRYAGSKNDVARMAQNFAGVQGSNDSRNDIVVRGNSPLGILYRLEGVDIPNPNHFAVAGTTGGPISMLNNNVMANSDFMTGAFPSEYGNALSGVFDLKMRNGNNEQHEFIGQFGFNGVELLAEGPFKKGKQASYLISYRYSTLKLFEIMGIDFGTASIPKYQDLSFKCNFPYKKGTITMFGVGGWSNIDLLNKDIDTTNNLFAEEGEDTRFRSAVGVAGMSITHFFKNNLYLKAVVSTTAHSMRVLNDSISTVTRDPFPYYRNNSLQGKNSLNIFLNKKFSSRHVVKTGAFLDQLYFQLSDSVYRPELSSFVTLSDFTGSVFLVQPYIQWQYRPSNDFTISSGIHYQHFTYNDEYSIEPRVGIQWKLNQKNAISAGYGLHSQVPPSEIYFEKLMLDDGTLVQVNTELGFTKSHHFVIGYDRSISNNIRLKTEAYYQDIFNVPVDANPNAYSLLNQGANFGIGFPDSLINEGTGRNYGVEITAEHFLSNGFYFLITASFYESKYKGSNGVEFNTAFNGNHTLNVLGGKEFYLGKKDENGKRSQKSVLTTDIKFTLNGGQRYTPVLLEESRLYGAEIRDWNNAYSQQYDDYIRFDLRIGFKKNGKRITQEWALDMQNLFGRKNIFQQVYNPKSGEIATTYQVGFLPVGQYRIEF